MRVVHVAVGVIVGADGKILIAKRSDTAHQGGLWEFPGGKVDAGELVQQALARELQEELAIQVITSEPLIKVRHNYADKAVLLDVWKITQFTGTAVGNEGQPVQWTSPGELANFDFPAANKPIITAINLPKRWLITGEAESNNEFLDRTETALRSGISLVQLRVKNPLEPNFPTLVKDISELCKNYGAKVQLNTSLQHFLSLDNLQPNTGLHLNSKNLLQLQSRSIDKNIWLSASCHNETEINHAQKTGVDFFCLSPILHTTSHPDSPPLGWSKFAELVEKSTIRAFALGGMREQDLSKAISVGAQGIAAISEWWH